MPYSILLIEDDPLIGQGVQLGLQKRGYSVTWLQKGQSVLSHVQANPPEIIILDLQLPDIGGMQILEKLRRNDVTAAIIIATARDRLEDRITGLDAGADDYIVKPYSTDELAARIRAMGRRLNARASERLTFRDLELDMSSRSAWLGGETINLTPSELVIISNLMTRVGEVVTLSHLRSQLAQPNTDSPSNMLQVHVHSLRKKIGAGYITTVRGVGYILK